MDYMVDDSFYHSTFGRHHLSTNNLVALFFIGLFWHSTRVLVSTKPQLLTTKVS